jgi:acetyl/propionyl-CoA carboxylase alpha subunit
MAGRIITLKSTRGEDAGTVEILHDGQVRVGEHVYRVHDRANGSLTITEDGGTGVRAWMAVAGDTRWVFIDGRVFTIVEPSAEPAARRRGTGHDGTLAAPMPATVRRVLVSPGDPVRAGDTLIVLEAMKMELPVRSNTSGVVRSVLCREGELVQPGVTLIEVDAAETSG